MKLKRIAASVSIALALGCTVLSAHAANPVIGQNESFDFGVLNQSMGVSVGVTGIGFSGLYDNTFTFTQASFAGATSLFAGIDGRGGMTSHYRLGTVSGTTTTWIATSASSAGWNTVLPTTFTETATRSFQIDNSFGSLVTGTKYAIEIAGHAGAGQSIYSLTLAPVTAVPEPESFALLLAGLGLVGAVARRRRNVVAA